MEGIIQPHEIDLHFTAHYSGVQLTQVKGKVRRVHARSWWETSNQMKSTRLVIIFDNLAAKHYQILEQIFSQIDLEMSE